MEYLWEWFIDLRSLNVDLTFTELNSWCDLSKIKLEPDEVTALLGLERIRKGLDND